MYHPDQRYTAHTLYLADRYAQAEQQRMIAALPHQSHTTMLAAVMRLHGLLVMLGAWRAQSTRHDEHPA